jgi:hypothetical protein
VAGVEQADNHVGGEGGQLLRLGVEGGQQAAHQLLERRVGKIPGFKQKKPAQWFSFLGFLVFFFWFFGFFKVFLGFLRGFLICICPVERVFRVFPVSRILLGASRL